MIVGSIKNQIDRIWDAFWSGGISNPMEVIEQLTYLLFIKRLDDKYLLQKFVRDQILTKRKDAINQSSINQGDVRSLQINVPPLALQEKFDEVHNRIARQRSEAGSSAQLLDAFFGSLQQRAFAGML